MAIKQYSEQKRVEKRKALVYDAIQKHDVKITKDIKADKSSRKKLWDNIDRLRRKSKTRKQECKLYDEKGEQVKKVKQKKKLINSGLTSTRTILKMFGIKKQRKNIARYLK